MKVRLDIRRYDPDSKGTPEYQTFEIDADPGETVSGVLRHIYENVDSGLAFRFVCNMQKCGECSVMVNNTPCLACEKRIEPEMKIDPLPNAPLIKDLVVDRYRAISDILRSASLLKDPAGLETGGDDDPVPSENSVKMEKCLECLICQAACPVFTKKRGSFIGPLGLLWLARRDMELPDPMAARDDASQEAFSMCDYCGRCWKACPDEQNFLADALKRLKGRKEDRDTPAAPEVRV